MKFEIETPDGKVFEIESDRMPTEQDINNIIGAYSSTEQPKPNIQPLTEEQKAKPRATNWADVAREGLIGFGEGVESAVNSAINGATLGGYGWLDRKLGLGVQDKKDELQRRAEEEGLGGLNTAGQLVSEIGGNIAGGGGAIAKGMSKAGYTGLKNALMTNAAEGVAYGYTDTDKAEDLQGNIAKNAILGVAVPLAGRGLGGVGKGAGKVLGFTTGTGDAITNAFDAGVRGSEDFLNNMRGKTNLTNAVDKAKQHLNRLKKARTLEYTEAMDRVGVKENVEMKPIINAFKSVKKSAGKDYLTDDGVKKVLNKSENMLKNFANDPTNTNVFDFDALKRAIGDIHANPNDGAAMRVKTQIYNAVKDSINKQAPEYAKVMKNYQDVTDEIMEFEKSLSLKDGKSPAQALKKLQSALRNNAISGYGNNSNLIKKLQGKSNDLVDTLSGQALSSRTGRGALGNFISNAGLYGAIWEPTTLLAAIASSPRLMGELAYKAGQAKRLTAPLSKPVGNYLDNYTASLINILENQ